MEPLATDQRVTIEVRESAGGTREVLIDDARTGLSGEFKQLPPKYFYDERGSELFERITETPEYYPYRAERAILAQDAAAIVAAAGNPGELIELGSGSASKTRWLLDAMAAVEALETYVPVDISEEITRITAEALTSEYPQLRVHGVVCDLEHDLEHLPGEPPRMFAFLGGTIGNFPPPERSEFLARIAAVMGEGDTLLLGTDLVKDRDRLEAAYNDAAGVTAEFNKNVLTVLNRELGANFDPDAFEHYAFYDSDEERIDIRLRSLRDQRARIADLDLDVDFALGEEMRTELSCKFTRESLATTYRSAGLEMIGLWTDPEELFALSLARPSRFTPPG